MGVRGALLKAPILRKRVPSFSLGTWIVGNPKEKRTDGGERPTRL